MAFCVSRVAGSSADDKAAVLSGRRISLVGCSSTADTELETCRPATAGRTLDSTTSIQDLRRNGSSSCSIRGDDGDDATAASVSPDDAFFCTLLFIRAD